MEKTENVQKQNFPGSGDLFLIGSVLAWGVNFPIAKSVLVYMDPLVFSASRYLAAACMLFLFLILRGENLRVSRLEALQLFGIGFVGITLFQGGWAYGLNLTTASKASILVSSAPIFGALFAIFRGEKTSLPGWVGIIVALMGVTLIINNSLTEFTLGSGSALGDFLIICAACAWAVYTNVSAPLVRRRGPLLVTAWAMLFGAIVLGVVGAPAVSTTNWGLIPASGWMWWAVTALLGAALAFVWYCAGISRLGVTRGMTYGFFIPVVAIATSMIFLGESMSLIQLGGACVVLFGVRLTRST